ncbi:glutathione peroxidase [Sphingobium nicotianae]|uniref:Glutathione peroxidase n=1 Tax=Sphingobium nicotianae TaxID=2782607 RepID=A0A9X1AI03_9SPHN|nr:glutathione peroxidase [Sphingobium nicotianae]MBT2185471.1 glutathione peroxidase [Sphingobium nicotianae]
MTALADIPVKTIKGADASLADYAGKVLLVVNVASKCGLTPQYEGLEKLYRDYRDDGLVVLGFPANEFAGQEPGTNEEIATFCTTNFGVDFPMFEKIVVKGPDKHPLYAELIAESDTPDAEVQWNFEKFLVSRDGHVVRRFSPRTEPSDPELVAAIEATLSGSAAAG